MRESSKPFQAPLLPPWRLSETKVRRDEEWSVSEWHFHCKGWGAPAELPGPHRSKVLSQHSLSAMQSGPLSLWLDLHRCIRHVPFEGKSHFRPMATCQSRPRASGILSTSSEILRSSGWPDVQVEVYATRRHIWGYSYELFLGHGISGTSCNIAFECGGWTWCCLWFHLHSVQMNYCQTLSTLSALHNIQPQPTCAEADADALGVNRLRQSTLRCPANKSCFEASTAKWNSKEVQSFYWGAPLCFHPRPDTNTKHQTPDATDPNGANDATDATRRLWILITKHFRTLSASDLDVMVASNSSV